MVGREHGAEGGDDAVEARVTERERLGVALDPFDVDARLGGMPARGLEQLRRHVEPDHPGPAERRRDRDVATAPGADIEQLDTRLDAARSITSSPAGVSGPLIR